MVLAFTAEMFSNELQFTKLYSYGRNIFRPTNVRAKCFSPQPRTGEISFAPSNHIRVKYFSPLPTAYGRNILFLKDATKATGTEISFNSLPPQTEQPYFHIHRKNEETYIILKGFGFFQVDEDCFSIKEGSVIRVAPQGKRGICNSSDETMIYMVIQSKENSLEEHTSADGERLPVEPKWR